MIMCITCNEKEARRLQVGSVDGPYWCSDECKRLFIYGPPGVPGEVICKRCGSKTGPAFGLCSTCVQAEDFK